MPRPKTLKECTFCHKSVYRIAGHGLCASCYYREKRNGTPNYTKVRKPCIIDGCQNLSVAQGLCDMHYRRLKKTGMVEGDRFDRHGHARSHPLYESWRQMRRQQKSIDPLWDDFWGFIKSVGEERPSEGHRLHRIDAAQPYGPNNFEWRVPIADVSSRRAKTEYMKAYRSANMRGFRSSKLKQLYGITLDQYEAMFASQNGVCAICEKPEPAVDNTTGSPRMLAVDHDHATKAVRQLLCSNCNKILGHAYDDLSILRRAAAYLERHAGNGLSAVVVVEEHPPTS